MGRGSSRQKPGDSIRASEIVCFAYCPEQWRLQYGQRLAPANREALAAGTRHHARKALAERVAGGTSRAGRFLLLLAFLGLLALLVLSR